jgi:hypothetical protein
MMQLAKLSRVQSLAIHDSNIDNWASVLAMVEASANTLQHLDIHACDDSDYLHYYGPLCINNLVTVSLNNMTRQTLQCAPLRPCNLRYVRLYGATHHERMIGSNVRQSIIERLLRECPIEHLYFDPGTIFSVELAISLAKAPRLTVLGICRAEGSQWLAVPRSMDALSKSVTLELLALDGGAFTNLGWAGRLANSETLREITFTNCDNVTDKVTQLLVRSKSLRLISFETVPGITMRTVELICASQTLLWASVTFCAGVPGSDKIGNPLIAFARKRTCPTTDRLTPGTRLIAPPGSGDRAFRLESAENTSG